MSTARPRLALAVLASLLATLLCAAPRVERPAHAEDAVGPAAPPTPRPAKQPFLWVVEGSPTIYLFGTIHVPDDRVKDIPAVATAALGASDVVWGEMSLEDLASPKISAAMMLPEGKKIADVVPESTAKRYHDYLAARGAPTLMLDRFKPAWAAVFIGLLDVLPLLATRVPMDKQLLSDAKKAGKEVGGLETAQEQIDVFEKIPADAAARFLDRSIEELEKAGKEGKQPFDPMVDAYASGDPERLLAETDKMGAVEDEEIKKFARRMLPERNIVMVERILERSKPGKTYFVAVGAGHYPGPEGILALLEKKGKKTRRLAADETIARPETSPAKEPEAAPTK